MKNLKSFAKISIGFSLVLFVSIHTLQAQDLVTFTKTSWYISSVTETKEVEGQEVSSVSQFGQNENIIRFRENGMYNIKTNFFGADTSMTGYWAETEKVVSLGTPDGDAYFWVFQVDSKMQDEVKLTFIPFKDIGQKLELIAKPYQEIQGVSLIDTTQTLSIDGGQQTVEQGVQTAVVSGRWLWSLAGTPLQLALDINQTGTVINGEHIYSKEGKEQKYFLSGTMQGNTANVYIYANQNKDKTLARAILRKIDNKIVAWEIKELLDDSFDTIDKINLEAVNN